MASNPWVDVRRLVDTGVLLAVVWLLAGTWCVAVYTVSGMSMAPYLWGLHAQAHCTDCGFAFRYDADPLPPEGQPLVCPNCDARFVPPQRKLLGGDWLLIDRTAYLWATPQRWQVAATRYPPEPHDVAVKRVVGLPGEEIELRDGEVYANGQLVRKSLAVLRRLAVLVHDASHEPTDAPPDVLRWRGTQARTRWTRHGAGYRFDQTETGGPSSAGEIDWLEYHHQVRWTDGRVELRPIDDRFGGNQSRPVFQRHAVSDVLLDAHLRGEVPSPLWLRVRDGEETFTIYLDAPAGRIVLDRDGQAAVSAEVAPAVAQRLFGPGCRLELALVDQQVFVAIDGQPALRHQLERSGPAAGATPRPLAVGVRTGNWHAGPLRVWRDLYYAPRAADRTQPHPSRYLLAADQYLLLGDNVPDSDDSRHWRPPGVAFHQILGRGVRVSSSFDGPNGLYSLTRWSD